MASSENLAVCQGSGLHRFAVLTAVVTLGLLGIGGLVTSHGAGMAVPDWPNTYGYNLFLFPVSQWVGGVFYEHTHRLVASGVGLLTVVLVLWLHGRNARGVMRWGGLILLAVGIGAAVAVARRGADGVVVGLAGLAVFAASWFWPRCEPSAKGLRWWGIAALVAVVLQGVLGGLRVVLLKDALGIFHAMLAQLFFVLICAIALFTSRWWRLGCASRAPAAGEGEGGVPAGVRFRLLTWVLLTTVLILIQLALGAAMRHQHAGLAIPDFPLAYGRFWPATDAGSVARYNRERLEVIALNPITASQIGLQMTHRLLALAILGAVGFVAWSALRALGRRDLLSRLALGWLGLIVAQALLGAATIWSNKAADIATAHVLAGALSLATGAMMSLIASRELAVRRPTADSPAAARQLSILPLQPQPSTVANLH